MFSSLFRDVIHPPAVGIDISDATVKLLRLERAGGRSRVSYFFEFRIPEGLVVDGEVKNESELIAALRKFRESPPGRRVTERYAIASLPEEKSFVRVVELPKIPPEEIGKAVRWEVEGVIPLPAEELFFDHEAVPSPDPAADHQDVLITAFPRTTILAYHRVLSEAGFVPLALELESQAISRAVIDADLMRRASIIIDLGANRTTFIIFAGGSLLFTKSIAVGGRNFEAAIGDALGVGPAEARQIKIEAGLNKNYESGKAFRALSPHLEAIVAELKGQLIFYRDHPQKRHETYGDISAVILCGGDANLIGIEKYIATAVKRPTLLANPFANLAIPPGAVPPVPKSESLKYTTAIGLALRGLGA